MRRFVYVFLCLLGVSLFFVTCSNSDSRSYEDPDQMKQKEFAELRVEIAALNLRYADQFCEVMDTRGWFFGRWLKRIFASDALGAAIGASCGGIGAVVGGIFGSLMATCVAYEEDGLAEYIPTEENLFEDSIAEEDVATDAGEEESEEEGIGFMKLALGGDQTTDDPEEDIAVVYDGFDRVGGLHNKIICDIYEESAVRELNSDELLQLVADNSSGYYDAMLSVMELTNIKTQVSIVANNLCDTNCEDPYINLGNAMPQYVNEFSIIKEYCEKIAGLCYDKALLMAYLEEFVNIIQNSDVSQTSKNMLKAAACVGANSCVLWQAGEPGESGSDEEETEN